MQLDEDTMERVELMEMSLMIERGLYKKIERVSQKLGLDPASWIHLVLLKKFNEK